MTTELYEEASAMKNSFEHDKPSKKNTLASQGVGAGVKDSVGREVRAGGKGEGVGSGVITGVKALGSGVGGMELHIST
jgi:hypothetical protein